MGWERTTWGRLVCNLGAYRGVVERTENDRTWSARVEAPETNSTPWGASWQTPLRQNDTDRSSALCLFFERFEHGGSLHHFVWFPLMLNHAQILQHVWGPEYG